MKNWLLFFKERLPLLVLLLMTIGFVGSSQSFEMGLHAKIPLVIGISIAFGFFMVMRVMDEVKDFEKDKLAHPERPLPRGLITLRQAHIFINGGLTTLMLEVLGLYFFGFGLASGLLLLTVVYLYLMFKEFYIGTWLERHLIIYLISHQFVLLLLSATVAALSVPQASNVSALLRPGILLLGAFFTYEIARKLDPAAPPILSTYRVHYGILKTGYLLGAGCLITTIGLFLNANNLGVMAMILSLGPLSLVISYPFLIREKFKILESLAGLLLLVFLWAPFIASLLIRIK